MNFEENLEKIIIRHKDITDKLSNANSGEEFSQLSKDLHDISKIVDEINIYRKINDEIKDLESIINDTVNPKEFIDLAKNEIIELKKRKEEQINVVKISLLPKDHNDEKNAIIEIRAGSGGLEAGLFVSDLLNMYLRYAENQRWKSEILSTSSTGIGGFKEVVLLLKGKSVYSKIKHESGVHRVQRVPETETNGRTHTSAASVAVLPEVEEVDVEIDPKDLKIDTYRSSGAGGQHVNTTDSAVRITHLPTGIVVVQQDERSQQKNKNKALKILRAKIYEINSLKQKQEISDTRKSQIGTGDRSERIRTYNFPQGRVTDHRINLTIYKIEDIVKHGMLNDLVEALLASEEVRKISEL